MATLTMQYYKRTGEMKDETLSFPLKDKPFGWTMNFIYTFVHLERMWCVGPTHARWHVWIEYLRWHGITVPQCCMSEGSRCWTIGESIVTVYVLGKWTCHTSRTFIFYFYLYANVLFTSQCEWWTTTSHYCRDTSWSTQQVPTLLRWTTCRY